MSVCGLSLDSDKLSWTRPWVYRTNLPAVSKATTLPFALVVWVPATDDRRVVLNLQMLPSNQYKLHNK